CPSPLAAFHFPNAQTGYIVLQDGTVIQTANGGQSFSGKTAVPGVSAGGPHPTDVFFTSPTTGFVTVGGAGGVIYRTTDGGGSWVQKATAPQGLNGLFFVDANTGYAVGNANTVLKTTDGGDTWTTKDVGSIPSSTLTQIRCSDAQSC